MRGNNTYVEAVLTPGTRDFGFFDVFLELERADGLKAGRKKQKSIIMSKDTMYVCQYVQSPYAIGETELISKLEWRTGNVYKYLGDVPTTTRYRLATEELWIFLMVAMSKMGRSYMDVVADRLEDSNDVDLYYNSSRNSVCKSDGSVAPWNEIVLGLSHELIVK